MNANEVEAKLQQTYNQGGMGALRVEVKKYEKLLGKHDDLVYLNHFYELMNSDSISKADLMTEYDRTVESGLDNQKKIVITQLAAFSIEAYDDPKGIKILRDKDINDAFAYLRNFGGKMQASGFIAPELRETVDGNNKMLEQRAVVIRFARDNKAFLSNFFEGDAKNYDDVLHKLMQKFGEQQTYPTYDSLLNRDRTKDEEVILNVIDEVTSNK